MILLDSCTAFCTSLSATFGPQVTEWIAIAGVIALGWWKGRKIQATAATGIAAAKAEARSAHVQLAEIRGSLRPAAAPPAALGSGDSQTRLAPVIMPELGAGVPRPRPSMVDPSMSGSEPLPRPSSLPHFDDDDRGMT